VAARQVLLATPVLRATQVMRALQALGATVERLVTLVPEGLVALGTLELTQHRVHQASGPQIPALHHRVALVRLALAGVVRGAETTTESGRRMLW
jgi:hypothetical protein